MNLLNIKLLIDYIKHHKLIAFFALLALILFIGRMASASTLYEYYTPGGTGYRGEIANSDYYRAQTFLSTTTAHTICSVKMKGGRDGAGGTAYMQLYAVSGGLPTGSALGLSDAFDYSGVSDYPTENTMEFIFAPCISIDTSTNYAWSVYRTSGTLWLSGLDPGAYSDGDMVYSNNAGGTWTSNNPADLWFEIYGEAAEEPPAPAGEINYSLILAVVMAGLFILFLFDMLRRHFIMK